MFWNWILVRIFSYMGFVVFCQFFLCGVCFIVVCFVFLLVYFVFWKLLCYFLLFLYVGVLLGGGDVLVERVRVLKLEDLDLSFSFVVSLGV